MSSVVGSSGASQSSGVLVSRGDGPSSSWVEDGDLVVGESDSSDSSVVWGCEPVFAAIRTRSVAV